MSSNSLQGQRFALVDNSEIIDDLLEIIHEKIIFHKLNHHCNY